MAKLPAMQNQYVEFAKNDGNGDKIDIKALNTAIEEGKSLDDIPILNGDTVNEIYNSKPKFLLLDDDVFVLQDIKVGLSDF